MTSDLAGVLGALVRDHPDILQQPKVLRAFLSDMFPGEVRSANLLLLAATLGVPSEMRDAPERALVPGNLQRLARKLTDAYGMERELAAWAVATWASAIAPERCNSGVNGMVAELLPQHGDGETTNRASTDLSTRVGDRSNGGSRGNESPRHSSTVKCPDCAANNSLSAAAKQARCYRCDRPLVASGMLLEGVIARGKVGATPTRKAPPKLHRAVSRAADSPPSDRSVDVRCPACSNWNSLTPGATRAACYGCGERLVDDGRYAGGVTL